MLKVPLVSKISVLDVLSKPVLSPLDLLIIDWSIHLDKSLTEQDVFLLMLLAIVPWQVNGVTELFLFIIEMVPHKLLKLVNFCLLIGVLLNLQHNLEESLVLIIQTFVENFKFIVPNIRFRCFVSSCKLVSVFEVSVLDVLSKPVLGKVHVLLGYRVGNPGQSFEEDVMLFLVGICITWFTAFHELLFFIIEVISVDTPVLVQKINIIRVFTELLHQIEEKYVLIIKPGVINLEGFIPNIRICHMVRHLSLVSEVSVMNMLSQPIGKGDPLCAYWSRKSSHSCKESIVL